MNTNVEKEGKTTPTSDVNEFKGGARNGSGSKKNYKKKNGRRQGGGHFNDDQFDRKGAPKFGKINAPEWYAASPDLLRDAGSLSFNNPNGSPIEIGSVGTGVSSGIANISERLPGIFNIRIHPCIGVATEASSPINVAARNLYTYVRHANSGHTNYEVADLMMYIFAMDQIYSVYNWAIRIYGLLSAYSQKNKYLPRALLLAQKIDPDDFIKHGADLRYLINSWKDKIGSMVAPSSMTLFLRHMWMYQNVYRDQDSEKAQYYMYSPDGFYYFTPVDKTTGGSLTYSPITATIDNPMKFDQFADYFETIFNPVYSSEDMNIMSGDILKAYGSEGVFKLAPLSEDYMVSTVYEEEVLSQMQNAYAVGNAFDGDDITQVDGLITYNPVFTETAPVSNSQGIKAQEHLLTLRKDSPEPGDVMVATRLTPQMEYRASTSDYVFRSVGSEFVTQFEIVTFTNSGELTSHIFDSAMMMSSSENYDNFVELLRRFCLLEKFNWHPVCQLVGFDLESDMANWVGFLGDVDNYTVLGSYTVKKLHETALLSEYAVPLSGAVRKVPVSRS